jgi:hypothetical protein
MSNAYQNQHYVSQVLLRRFADAGYLQRFSVQSNTWKRVSPKRVFSGLGYTQLLAYGETDNSLEASFAKIESAFPLTLKALDDAATRSISVLPVNLYENLFWYCAYVWRISPFAKAKAPGEFVMQLDSDLKNQKTNLLQAIGIPEGDINTIQQLHANGVKFILRGDDYLQVVYRIQFVRRCREDYWWFRHFAKWTICNSPIELPISDIALVQYFDRALDTTFYLLPISPNLILIGSIKTGTHHQSTDTTIRGSTLNVEEAEYCLDAICLSAVTALIGKSRTHDVRALRNRAREKKIRFCKIKDLESVLSAGTKPFNGPLIVFPVAKGEYVKYVKSFIGN